MEPNTPESIAEVKANYRASLLNLQEKMQSQYDKTVLSLSGGAFGVSVIAIKELIGTNGAIGSATLTLAWTFWGVSVLAVLCSFFSSAHAMEKAVDRIDSDLPISASLGGLPDRWTRALNITSGTSFMLGLGSFICFVSYSI